MRGKAAVSTIDTTPFRITPAYAGKDFFTCGELIPFGITPAYAGKSIYGKRYSGNIWDHPRLCGEKHYKKHR